MKKRILSIVLSIVMLVGLLRTTAWASYTYGHYGHYDCDGSCHVVSDPHKTVKVQDWQAWDSQNSLPDTAGSYYLTTDITLSEGHTLFKAVTICLNGHTITLGNGNILVGSNFTITDCTGNGKITGANLTNAGSVKVTSGTFNMYGGSITGNTATSGGGVYMSSNTIFNMYGGTITGNTAGNGRGGGVYMNGGTFNMHGGTITNNHAAYNGGGVHVEYGTFNLYGGEITDNRATEYGGGVYVTNSSAVNMSGGSITSNSTAYYNGGGVYVYNGTFTVSGKPVITGNTKESGNDATANNLYLSSGKKATVGDVLSEDAQIGVTMQASSGGTFTSGWNTYMPSVESKEDIAKYFTSDSNDFTVQKDTNELELVSTFVPVTGVELNKESTTLTVGGSETLTATVEPDGATNKAVAWSSDAESVATVENGVVTAVGEGTATITATTTDGGKTATCTVTVVPVHKHPICGVTCSHNDEHENKQWTPISTKEELLGIELEGHYYLTTSIDLGGSPWEPCDGVVLDLNGKTLSSTASNMIQLNNDVDFAITDCTSEGKLSHRNYVGCKAVSAYDTSTGFVFILYNGTIDSTGYVYHDEKDNGTFNQYGGSITSGGSQTIFIRYGSGKYNLYGGSVANTSETASATAVCVLDGTTQLTMKGDIEISAPVGIQVTNPIIIAGTLEMPSAPYTIYPADLSMVFTEGWNSNMQEANPADYFAATTHSPGYVPAKVGNELQLVEHTHGNWTYSYAEGTFTAKCHNEGCPTDYSVTATVIVDNGNSYDGNPRRPVSVNYSSDWTAAGAGTVAITGEEILVGTGSATLSIGDLSIPVEFTIGKGTLQPENFTVTLPTNPVYDGTAKVATVTANDGILVPQDKIIVKHSPEGLNFTSPVAAGGYAVVVKIEETEYYKGTEYFFLGERGNFTIAQKSVEDADVVVTIADKTYTGNYIELDADDVTVTYNGITLVLGTDYTLGGYSNSINAGTASVTITGNGNYTGNVVKNFNITYATKEAGEVLTWNDGGDDWFDMENKPIFTPKTDWTVSLEADGTYGESALDFSDDDEGASVTKTVYAKDGEEKIYQVTLNYKYDKTEPTFVAEAIDGSVWTNESRKIEVTVTSETLSGVKSVELYIGDVKQDVAFELVDGHHYCTVTENGNYTVKVTDNAGNYRFQTIGVTKIDKTAPSLQIGVPTGTGGNDGWFTSAVTVPVTAGDGDGESGLDKWYYSLNGGTDWTEGSNGSFVISADGDYSNTVKIKAVDMAGNETVTTIAELKIDTTAPGAVSVTAKVGEENYASGTETHGDVVITLTGGEDALSGFDKFQYKIGEDSWEDIVDSTYTHTASTVAGGVTYTFRAVDNAGNASVEVPFTVKKSFPVRFNANIDGATGTMEDTYIYQNGAVTMPACGFTKAGYSLVGWCTSADCTGECYLEGNELRDITESAGGGFDLYAKWQIDEYSVTILLNGTGADGPADFKYTVESDDITLTNPTRTGYTFKGWSGTGLEGDANLTVTIPTGSVGDRTYTANWMPIAYDISYTLNGGEATNPATYTIESETITLTNPTREGYTFKGWSGTGLEGDTNLNVTIAAGSVGDRTYTVNWTANEYTITYEGMDGAAYGENNPVKHTYDTPTAVSNPTKTGYTFAGWKVNGGEAQTALTLAGDGYTSDITLTATWTANSYKVVFNANGGTGDMADQSFTYDAAAQALTTNAYTREGYKFVGWAELADSTGVDYVDKQVVSNLNAAPNGEVTLYAVWTRDIILSGDIVAPNVSDAENLDVVLVGLDGTKYPVSVTGNASPYHYTVTVPEGEYQIIIKDTENDVTVTAKEELNEDKAEEPITMPEGSVNSIVDSTAAGDYTPIVGGLDDIAGDVANENASVDVTVTLTVTHEPANEENAEHDALMDAAGSQKSKLTFLEIDLAKNVGGTRSAITQTDDAIEIVIPFDTTRKQNFKVYRFHDGTVDVLTTTANTDGEYIEIGTGSVTIHAKKFSLYAIGYNDVIPYYPVTHSCTSKCDVCGGCEDAACTESACKDKCRLLVMNFTDVADSKWYTEPVEYVYHHKMMEGVGNNFFDINGTTTRAMIVTILWRLEGEPVVNYLMQFEDIPADTWYTEAVRWVASEKIVEGYSNTAFGPTDPITREQFATILWRYAKYKGYDVSVGEDTNILSYEDAFSISEYAIPAMQWACGAGLMQGDGVNLTPKADATRAQAAALFQRFCGNVAEK